VISAAALAAACAADPSAPRSADEATEAKEGVGHVAQALGFDWGSDCSAGNGQFDATIASQATQTIGEIPPNKRNVRIQLTSAVDVDVQLFDKDTGHAIVAWPSGDLHGATQACATYQSVQYCYSGYNGDGTGAGHEWIEVRGDSNRTLVMKAFGYQAGSAGVVYTWQAVDTCNEKGTGSFSQYIAKDAVADIGTIPADKTNVRIQLKASTDLDVQLFDGSTALVKWPDGKLNGAGQQTLAYGGMSLTWSGYGGDGTGPGNEYIRVDGRTSMPLMMRAYGYAAGTATVTYNWGVGAGAACGASGLPACATALVCKNGDKGNIAAGVAGACHTPTWCASTTSAAADCAAVTPATGSGAWTCKEFQCAWVASPAPYPVTVAVDGPGTVTSNVGSLACPGQCSSTYTQGTVVTLQATPGPAPTGGTTEFVGWTGGCTGSSPTCTLTVASAQTIRATFRTRMPPMPLNVSVTGAGTLDSTDSQIHCPSQCSAQYTYGSVVTLVATPSQGQVLAGWTGPCSGAGATCQVPLLQSTTVSAIFQPAP
jgi:hypothetical protein